MATDRSVSWLHLSDFHVGQDDDAQRRIFDHIHEHVRRRVEAEGPPDLVFVTGDLAYRGKDAEYATFYDGFLRPLRDDSLGGFAGGIFTVPGNHDVDRTVDPFFDRAAICRPESRFFDPADEGPRLRETVLRRFRAYRESEQSSSPDGWLASTAGAFSARLDIRGRTLGVVGINTAWLCKDDEDRHRLTPGVALVEAALREVRGTDACVVLGHHPLDWLLDDDVDSLRALLGEHHAIYLHGHLHRGAGRREDGAGQDFLAVQAGSCFQARDGERWINGLLWAELDLEHRELRLQPRHWNPKNRDWPLTAGAFPETLRRGDWWSLPLPGARTSETSRPRD